MRVTSRFRVKTIVYALAVIFAFVYLMGMFDDDDEQVKSKFYIDKMETNRADANNNPNRLIFKKDDLVSTRPSFSHIIGMMTIVDDHVVVVVVVVRI
jgi:hypothetical protein